MIRRRFLNRRGQNTVAAIYAVVDGEDTRLIISDCNHTVELEVGGYNDEQRANTLFKLDMMISVLKEFRDACAEEFKGRKDE